MDIGMSLACFYPLEPENAVPEAAGLNVRVCEIFLNTISELEEPYLYSLRELCDQHNIRVHSIHPFTSFLENYMFFAPYPRRIADSERLYERYAKAAKILGATVVNIHGDRGVGLTDIDHYVKCVIPLMRLQQKTGVIYALENVFYNSVNHPEFIARLRQKISEARFTLDIKQAFKGGEDAYAVAEAMGDAIVNFHVNDRDDDHICLLPGEGTVDYDRLQKILRSNHYDGPALIEVYRHNFQNNTEINRSLELLKSKFSLAK